MQDNFIGFVYVESTVNQARYALDIQSKYTTVLGDSGTGKTTFISSLKLALQGEPADMDMASSEFVRNDELLTSEFVKCGTDFNDAQYGVDTKLEDILSDKNILHSIPNISCSDDVIVKTNMRIMVLDNSTDTIRKAQSKRWLEFLSEYVDSNTLVCCDEDFMALYSRDFQSTVQILSCKFLFMTHKNLIYIPNIDDSLFEFVRNDEFNCTVLRRHYKKSRWSYLDATSKFEYYNKLYERGYDDRIL